MNRIDWTNPDQMVSKYFSVKECLWLTQWKRLANEADGLSEQIKSNIVNFSQFMDTLREYLSCAIKSHCLYRSPVYSKLVGGTETDAHTEGKAMDFDCLPVMTCDQVKQKLRPILETLKFRMEKNGDKMLWVHVDRREPGPSGREFTP